jgi:hypothetical protein
MRGWGLMYTFFDFVYMSLGLSTQSLKMSIQFLNEVIE